MSEPLRAAKRYTDQPDPEGWSAADVDDDERVDDEFIEDDIADLRTETRRYEPLQPEDEKLFLVYDNGGTLQPGMTLAYNATGEDEVIRRANDEDGT